MLGSAAFGFNPAGGSKMPLGSRTGGFSAAAAGSGAWYRFSPDEDPDNGGRKGSIFGPSSAGREDPPYKVALWNET